MRLSTYICAVIAPITVLVVVHIGCCFAEDSRSTGVTSRQNEETVAKASSNERKTSNFLNSETNSPYVRTFTDYDLTSRGGHRPCNKGQTRVAGGKAVQIEDYPFMASLERKFRHLCSLCILTGSWLVTAGHCTIYASPEVTFAKPTDFTVLAGTHLLTIDTAKSCVKGEVRRNVDHLMWHPKFDEVLLRKDLVLVRVSQRLPFSDRIQPAPLPSHALDTKRDLVTGLRCRVPGWGSPDLLTISAKNKTGGSGKHLTSGVCPDVPVAQVLELQHVTLPVLSIEGCIKKYSWAKSWLHEREHICTEPFDGKHTCLGDSGSPLICNDTVVALVSWGLVDSKNPTVFTRIDTDLDWLQTRTGPPKANQASPPPNAIVVVAVGQLAMALASICHA